MRIKAKDRDRMRIEFEEPAREKGRIILRVKDKMWMFLPDLGKAMVISSRQAFMGSAASNGDLLRTDLVSDYVPTLAAGTDPGQPYRLELKARAPDVTYDRIVMWVAREGLRPLRAEYYTRSGKRLKTLEYGDPAVLNGIAVNRRMTIHSDLQRDQVTVLSIVSLAPARDLPESMFVKENLDRR
jgi:outer membrane lipoprotein-sorting protein